jgi:hypothetical protein
MLGDVIELSVVVRDLDAAAARYTWLFGLQLLQPTDPNKAVGRFLARRGEGVYLVGFECADVPGAVGKLRANGAQVHSPRPDIAWVHPREAHGLFVELRHRERYD